MKNLAIRLIEFYQTYLSFDRGLLSFLAPFGCCKYQPTCSEYTKSQIIKYGTLKGSYLGLLRIISCR
ncbi:MAG: membrane protein insertion efficiency factor YidD [Candidatus Daviesbacteria bacterium]|nr:membrane protein insertion efficiency factor YidD [Candidatus Daviesbacteria bacterium]